MHKYGTTETLEKLKDGKDAVGLTCTGCHGGNPAGKTETTHEIERVKRMRMCSRVSRASGGATANTPARIRNGPTRCWRARVGSLCASLIPAICAWRRRPAAARHVTSVESKNVARSMMTHGAMLWGAALYNNGGFPLKDARFGESYSENGAPQTLIQTPQPTHEERRTKGLLEFLDPMPRWEISQPGNVLRVFERGGKRRLEVGLPDKEEEPGKPDKGLEPAWLWHRTAHRSGLSRIAEDAPARSDAELSRHQRSSRRLSLVGLLGVSRDLRQRSRSVAFGVLSARPEIWAVRKPPTRTFRRTNRAIRSSISSPARFRPRSAWSVTCTRAQTWSRRYLGMTWWDNESDGDKMYPNEATQSVAGRRTGKARSQS